MAAAVSPFSQEVPDPVHGTVCAERGKQPGRQGGEKLVISHSVGDEGDGYAQRVRRYADMLDVPVIFAGQWIDQHRGTAPKRFTLQDVFPQVDLVTYPSTYEGLEMRS